MSLVWRERIKNTSLIEKRYALLNFMMIYGLDLKKILVTCSLCLRLSFTRTCTWIIIVQYYFSHYKPETLLYLDPSSREDAKDIDTNKVHRKTTTRRLQTQQLEEWFSFSKAHVWDADGKQHKLFSFVRSWPHVENHSMADIMVEY